MHLDRWKRHPMPTPRIRPSVEGRQHSVGTFGAEYDLTEPYNPLDAGTHEQRWLRESYTVSFRRQKLERGASFDSMRADQEQLGHESYAAGPSPVLLVGATVFQRSAPAGKRDAPAHSAQRVHSK